MSEKCWWNTLLQWYFNKFISKYEIFQGVCEDCTLTSGQKQVTAMFLLRKIFKRLEMVTLRKKPEMPYGEF